jgi:hypothetical protein
MLPHGGFVVAFEAYADSSGTQGPVLSTASFVFEIEKSKDLHSEWSKILLPFLKDEPPEKQYFHMYEFFTRKKPYSGLTDGEWLALQRSLIDSAHATMEYGVVASVRLSDYENHLDESQKALLGGPFAMCNLWCMDALCEHLKGNGAIGDIAYLFEDGDSDKDNLEIILAKIEASKYLKYEHRYGGRTFLPKYKHHAFGAADMLAWEYRNGVTEYLGNPETFEPRVFLDVLFEKPIGARHFSPINLKFRSMGQSLDIVRRRAHEARDWDRYRDL